MKFSIGDYIKFIIPYPVDGVVYDGLGHGGKVIDVRKLVDVQSGRIDIEYQIDWENDHIDWHITHQIDKEYILDTALMRKLKLETIL